MCIVLFTTAHPDYPLILIDNRDEFILRPTSRPHWWTHPTSGEQVLSSRDLQRAEKGTWLGITKSGIFAVLTNYREADAHDASHPVHGRKSRGAVVTAWLAGLGSSIKDGVEQLVKDDGVKGVGGFSLVCGKLRKKGEGIAIVSNRAGRADEVPIVAEQRGETWGLSNTTFDAEAAWPKVELGTRMLREAVAGAVEREESEERLVEALFGVLDTDTFPAARPGASFEELTGLLRHTIFVPELGDEGHLESMEAARAKGRAAWARDEGKLRAVEEILLDQQPEVSAQAANGFETGTYGTQRQTVVLVDWDGNVKVVERALWDRNGHRIERGHGDVVFEFAIEGWDGDSHDDRQ
ncbi:hypothetical protein J3459_008036 [Metarhizium acridum]|uniref:DUF833 domain-containing protein n=1 Tax=Metarhizium acridum (strain CQMa 102) TaxID=655827 RepID=E9E4L1_METAQ|nr:DUF833 domain-containing protein [Metarhizium acridum CQMa 102]EFY89222.1 DUF833 domain-containing protein [Metarhizium acridum CQMa 102]KAG8426559.1 hypothetical protein J3459_008036 [Metarhizium acridum]